jgi:hypothetical protein
MLRSMHLVYLDESGNSGSNLNDPQQPIFVLCAMVVAEERWQSLERDLQAALDHHLPQWRSVDGFEVHAADLRTGRGSFAGMSVSSRIAFRDDWMSVAQKHEVRLISRSVDKKRYAAWLHKTFGSGVMINPHVVAFALVARCVDDFLQSLQGNALGMLISDENKEIVADVEKSISLLRGDSGKLRLARIVEKGFFIDSTKSLPLQLCDLFALSARKKVERAAGLLAKSIDESGISMFEKLSHSDRQNDPDVLEWLKKQQSANRSGS